MIVSDKTTKFKKGDKPIDPNVLVNQWYKTGTSEKIEIGRGVRKFLGHCDFTFYFVHDPSASLLSQPEDPNFCIGSISFRYGKDQEQVSFMSYGPSPRVLDAVLATVDKYYHEDIVDWHSSKKLSYISDKVKKDDKEDGKKKLKQGMDIILEGFKKRREVTGKPAPQFFKSKDQKVLDVTTDALYAAVILTLGVLAGGGAVQALLKGDLNKGALQTLKAALKGKDLNGLIRDIATNIPG